MYQFYHYTDCFEISLLRFLHLTFGENSIINLDKLKTFMENDYVGVLKYRQGGITTVTILYVCWVICTQNDIKFAIVADKLKLSIDVLK